MIISENIETAIHITLKKLIEAKALRDNIKFTACQLAEALNMPRSMITKLTHFDKSKRVTNPRIDTLMKIVDYFRADGFNVTIEDLIGREIKTIDIKNQLLHPQEAGITIPVYSFSSSDKKLGVIDIKLTQKNKKNVFALYAEQDIKPFFKAASVFVIEPEAPLEDDVLVAVKLATNMVQIKKYCVIKNKIILKSLNDNEKDLPIMPTTKIAILGVVIQVNANT